LQGVGPPSELGGGRVKMLEGTSTEAFLGFKSVNHQGLRFPVPFFNWHLPQPAQDKAEIRDQNGSRKEVALYQDSFFPSFIWETVQCLDLLKRSVIRWSVLK